MRTIFLLVLCLAGPFCFAQKISYDIPEGYAQSISKENYKKMVDLATVALSKRFTVQEVNGGTIKTREGQIFNLHNLILACASTKDKAAWEEQVKGHFENIFATMDAQKKIDPEKYETIREMLALRIYPDEMIRSYGGVDNLMNRTDLDGTKTVLMLDLPGSFTPIQKDLLAKWKKDSAEVFRQAQLNMNKQKVDTFTQEFVFENDIRMSFNFIVEENYASGYALDLITNCPQYVGNWGAVVAMPNKAMVAVCKVAKDSPVDFVKFIERTRELIGRQYAQHPQPVSPDYFWYYKGRFTKINVMENNGKINVVAPTGLGLLMVEQK